MSRVADPSHHHLPSVDSEDISLK